MDNAQKEEKKYILITGASKGIGYATAILLADNGFYIYAGVRKQEDFDRLKTLHKNITPVFLDVINEESINNAYSFISDNCSNLYAVINNAGTAIVEPIEIVSVDTLKYQFELNTFAPIRIIQKFAPLIKHGKIINIDSIASEIEIPFASPYCASKKALETFINAYSKETSNKNIKFVLLKPGTLKTDLWNKNPENYKNTPYYNILRIFYYLMNKYSSMFGTPKKLGSLILKILKAKNPKSLYYFGLDAYIIKYFKWLLPPLINSGLKILKSKAEKLQ